MTFGGFYFCCCSLLGLVGALATVLSRSPIRGALGLLVTVVAVAGLFLQLDAQLLAAVQVLVSVGVVVVFIVFVVQILGADATDPSRVGKAQIARIIGGVGMLVLAAIAVFSVSPEAIQSPLVLPRVHAGHGSVAMVGRRLFTVALVPFELTAALLVTAVVGVIAVSRERHRAKTVVKETNPTKRLFGGPIHPRDAGRPIAKEVES
jgi:NADH-quinone oxidoreductase subunit J